MAAATLITFDAGQVLVELDLDFLARRLTQRGVSVGPAALGAAAPAAWRRHDQLVKAGARHPWHDLMRTLLGGAGLADFEPLVEWLWDEQPRANLWRRPIAPVIAIARDLAKAGHRVAVLSNSEGRLAELLDEIGIADPFVAVIDSGRVGVAKPDRRIFDHARAASGIGDDAPTPIHVGDSWAADIVGARGAGWRAIWYGEHVTPVDDVCVGCARDPDELRTLLDRWLAGSHVHGRQ